MGSFVTVSARFGVRVDTELAVAACNMVRRGHSLDSAFV